MDIHKFLDRLRDEAIKFRSSLERDWKENEELLYVSPETDVREVRLSPSARVAIGLPPRPPGIVINEALRLVTHAAALISGGKPAFEFAVTSLSGENTRWNVFFRKVVDSVWIENDAPRLLGDSIFDIYTYGSSFWRVEGWDYDRDRVVIRRVPPRYVYVDPGAQDLGSAAWILYRAPVTLWDLHRIYPSWMLENVKPDPSLSSAYDTRTSVERVTGQSGDVGVVPRVWYEEWLIRSPDRDESGNLLYPRGRLIVRAGGVVLIDMPYPHWEDWPGPWIHFRPPYGAGVYGYPILNSVRPIQKWLNIFTTRLLRSVYEGVKPVWLVDLESMPPTEERKLGAVVRKLPHMEVRRDLGLGISPGVPEVIQTLSQKLSYVIGLSEVIGARPPRSVTAAAALEALTASTQAALNWIVRGVESSLARVGSLIAARVLQYAPPHFVTWYMHPYGKVEVESIFLGDESERKEVWRRLRVAVRPSSVHGLYKERQESDVLQKYSMGLLDRQAAMEQLDIPDWPEILRRMESQAALGARDLAARVGPAPRGRGASIVRARIGGR